MKKVLFVFLVIAGAIYYFKDDIKAKKEEMQLASFKKAQEEFWKGAKKCASKKKVKKIFAVAEKDILNKKIDSIECEDLYRYMRVLTIDQAVDKNEIKALESYIKALSGKAEPIIRG